MKKIVMTMITLAVAQHALAYEKCAIRMQNTASYHLAEKLNIPVQQTQIIRFEMGSWTKALQNNTGSATVAINDRHYTKYFKVFGLQINDTNDCKVTKLVEIAKENISSHIRQAEKYKRIISDFGYDYNSDAETTWQVFYSKAPVAADTPLEQVKVAIGSGDRKVSKWSQDDIAEMFDHYTNDSNGSHEQVWEYKRLYKTMLKDFKEVQAYEVEAERGDEVYIYLVGRHADGQLIGLKTYAIRS